MEVLDGSVVKSPEATSRGLGFDTGMEDPKADRLGVVFVITTMTM